MTGTGEQQTNVFTKVTGRRTVGTLIRHEGPKITSREELIMTQNQISYWNLQELKRSNAAREAETARSNRANEYEANRSNVARESETNRHNVATELISSLANQETQRSNIAREAETARSNLANEAIKSTANAINYYSASEQARTNKANEQLKLLNLGETIRSNLARETETNRSNLARETETNRSNLAQEAETVRNNIMNNTLTAERNAETARSNRENEFIKKVQTQATVLNDIATQNLTQQKIMADIYGNTVRSIGSAAQSLLKAVK